MEIMIYGETLPEFERLQRLAEVTESQYQGLSVHFRRCADERQLMDEMLRAAEAESRETERYFPISSGEGIRFITLSQIVYFKTEGHRLCIVSEDGAQFYTRTLRVSVQQLLAPLVESGRFLQVYRAVFVNAQHVQMLLTDAVHMDNGETLPVSRRMYSRVFDEAHGKRKRKQP